MDRYADRTDRVAKYLKKLNEGTLFDELSDEYLRKANIYDILHGVPIPISAGLSDELTTLSIGINMARVIGGDPDFVHRDAYLAYMDRLFGDEFIKVLISEGAKYGGQGNYELACIFFRAALLIDAKSKDAMYLYGRACKDAYEIETNDEDYVGCFKAESLEMFEMLTLIHPDFDMGFYFLGYGYANLGLYVKAKLTWETFMDLTEAHSEDEDVKELREEIEERLKALEEPVVIEQGCNCVLEGNFVKGREILSKYTEGAFSKWWPLWYYLAVCEAGLGNVNEAIDDYKKALNYSPSNINIMEELASVYEAIDDTENAVKYRNKIEIVKMNIADEQGDV